MGILVLVRGGDGFALEENGRRLNSCNPDLKASFIFRRPVRKFPKILDMMATAIDCNV